MTTIKIDDAEYNLDKLSEDVKAQLVSPKFCDQELAPWQGDAMLLI